MPASLGRGLDALLSRKRTTDTPQPQQQSAPTPSKETLEVGIDLIDVNPHQPRHEFVQEELESLANSIRQYGILQPLIVTKTDGRYQLIAGERRLRAARLAGLTKVPVVFRDADANTQIAIALIENIQRVDLNPIDLAFAYRRLNTEFALSQEKIAEVMGKKRPTITNTLRLLTLPEEIQDALRTGKIDMGMGKVILTLASPREQVEFLRVVLEKKLTRDEAENFLTASRAIRPHTTKARDVHLSGKEEELREQFGTKVVIKKSKGRGTITISFYTDDEYHALVQRLLEA